MENPTAEGVAVIAIFTVIFVSFKTSVSKMKIVEFTGCAMTSCPPRRQGNNVSAGRDGMAKSVANQTQRFHYEQVVSFNF